MSIPSESYVLDASVVVRAFLEIEYAEQSRGLLESLGGTGRVIAPELLYVECASAVWKYVRHGALPLQSAEEIIEQILRIDIRIVPLRDLAHASLLVASSSEISVYDACYVVTALSQDAVLITADHKLIQKASQVSRIMHIANYAAP